MSTVHKDRDERVLLGIDFTARLQSVGGDALTLASVDLLEIVKPSGADMTAEFRTGEAAPTIDGNFVLFWAKLRSANEQQHGLYDVRCRVELSNGEEAMAKTDTGDYHKLLVGGSLEEDPQ
jgi:hypothetical protein